MTRINDFHICDPHNALQSLRDRGAEFWIEDGRLRYRAPKGRVTPEDIAAACRANPAVLSLLSRQGKVRGEPYLLERPDPIRAPLSITQLGHWNMRATANHRPIRQVASATRLRGSLDVGALGEAVSIVVTRHEALRTNIVLRSGEPRQEISARPRCDFEILDLTHMAADRQTNEVQRQIGSAIVDVTDYAAEPLFLAALLNLGPKEGVLILAMDHIVSDGASLSIVFNELLTVHDQLVNGGRVSLPAVQMQMADYANWQRMELAGFLARRGFEWSSWPTVRFPEDPNSTEDGNQGWATLGFMIEARLKEALQIWARRHGTSLVMTVLTAYVATVQRWCGESETIVQFISDGRLSPLLENTVGDIMIPLYLRVSVEKCRTFVDLLHHVIEGFCRANEQLDFGAAYVQTPLPSLVHSTMFNWLPLRGPGDGRDLVGTATALSCSNVAFDHPALHQLDWDGDPGVTFWDSDEEVVGEVSFPRKRFVNSSMRRFAGGFLAFLEALPATPAIPVRDVALRL